MAADIDECQNSPAVPPAYVNLLARPVRIAPGELDTPEQIPPSYARLLSMPARPVFVQDQLIPLTQALVKPTLRRTKRRGESDDEP